MEKELGENVMRYFFQTHKSVIREEHCCRDSLMLKCASSIFLPVGSKSHVLQPSFPLLDCHFSVAIIITTYSCLRKSSVM